MNKYLENWQKKIEDLELNLSLDQDDIQEAYERQKAGFQSFLDKAKTNIDQLNLGQSVDQVKAKIEELEVQLALGKAESKEAFEAQKQKLDHSLQELSQEYKKLKAGVDSEYHEAVDKLSHDVEGFHTKLDVFKLHFHLGKSDLAGEWEDAKKDLNHKLQDLRKKVEKGGEEAEEKWEDLTEEVGEAYSHFKNTLSGLFSGKK